MVQRSESRRRHRADRGGVLAEFAIVVPVALLLLLGAVDFGRVWALASASANAAHAGAQYGSQNPQLAGDIEGMRTVTINDLASSSVLAASNPGEDGITLSDFVVTPERYCECSGGAEIACDVKCGGGSNPMVFVRVRVDTMFQTLFDYPGIPNEVRISREAVLRAR
jgi:Flp pilus assembly protein TadG